MKRGGADSPKPLSYLSWIWRLNAGLVFLTVLRGSEEGCSGRPSSLCSLSQQGPSLCLMYKVFLLGKVPCPQKVIYLLLLKPQAVRIVDFCFWPNHKELKMTHTVWRDGNKINSKL